MTALDTQDAFLFLLPRLRRYARVLTADRRRADELVLHALSRVRGARSEPAAWRELRYRLLAVMHRVYYERSAHERRAKGELRVAGAPEPSYPTPLLHRGGADETLQRLARLPVEQREVLVLVVLEGLPYAEVATLLDVPIGTVLSRLNGAREAMRSIDGAAASAPRPE